MIKASHYQQGSAFIVTIVILTVALIGALGFIFWQNFISKDPIATQTETSTKSESKESNQNELNVKELGKTISLSNAPYNDITYTMTAVNSDDTDKYVAAIYSKDLNGRLVADSKKTNSDSDYSDTYSKLSRNHAVYAYYYDPPVNSMYPDMIDGVASNIVNFANKSENTKLYIGFMGPGSPSDETLSNENMQFKAWVEANLK